MGKHLFFRVSLDILTILQVKLPLTVIYSSPTITIYHRHLNHASMVG